MTGWLGSASSPPPVLRSLGANQRRFDPSHPRLDTLKQAQHEGACAKEKPGLPSDRVGVQVSSLLGRSLILRVGSVLLVGVLLLGVLLVSRLGGFAGPFAAHGARTTNTESAFPTLFLVLSDHGGDLVGRDHAVVIFID